MFKNRLFGRIFACVLVLTLGSFAPARAALKPFVLAGGSSIRAEKTDLDEMLDEYTIHQHSDAWEAGGGFRLIPSSPASSQGSSSRSAATGGGPIEIRFRFTLGGGSLPGTRFDGWRTDYSYRNRFRVSSSEAFNYHLWSVGSFFSAWVYDRLGFYLGPVLQSVNYEADRSWTGPTDCNQCGPATDRSTNRYGTVEAGAHYTLRQIPLRLEGFWVPKRFALSTTHIVRSENYEANFSSLKDSFGARLSWEF